eukprot:EG_transcript_48029
MASGVSRAPQRHGERLELRCGATHSDAADAVDRIAPPQTMHCAVVGLTTCFYLPTLCPRTQTPFGITKAPPVFAPPPPTWGASQVLGLASNIKLPSEAKKPALL